MSLMCRTSLNYLLLVGLEKENLVFVVEQMTDTGEHRDCIILKIESGDNMGLPWSLRGTPSIPKNIQRRVDKLRLNNDFTGNDASRFKQVKQLLKNKKGLPWINFTHATKELDYLEGVNGDNTDS
jgi:hypothetical protein